jgi:uncharacterized protein
MKYLLLIVIVLAVLFVARAGSRRSIHKAPQRPPERPDGTEPMLACAHCGIHLPRGESLPGRGGVFCDEAHRAAYERIHPV